MDAPRSLRGADGFVRELIHSRHPADHSKMPPLRSPCIPIWLEGRLDAQCETRRFPGLAGYSRGQAVRAPTTSGCPPLRSVQSIWLFQPIRFGATIGGSIELVNIASPIFECSAPDLESCPDETLPEFAFIGRSNVGKSSLLNMLTGKRDLARVSPTPGFTKLINFFVIDQQWRLVDLPGYGYSRVARKDSARFNDAVTVYLRRRPNLCCVFALIDSGLPPQKKIGRASCRERL